MKVYLAARFSRKDEMRMLAQSLALQGVTVTSRWLKETVPATAELSDLTPYYAREVSFDDIEDIRECDSFVLFTESPDEAFKRGGRHWETGFAYGIGKPVILCGPRENIFHFLPNVTQLNDVTELKSFLAPERVN